MKKEKEEREERERIEAEKMRVEKEESDRIEAERAKVAKEEQDRIDFARMKIEKEASDKEKTKQDLLAAEEQYQQSMCSCALSKLNPHRCDRPWVSDSTGGRE